MKPTERTANHAATLKTGRLATLGSLLRAAGGGTPIRNLIATPLIILCALSALLELSVGIAQAEPSKLISYGSFVSEGPGVAVDQSNGDIFTAGLLNFAAGTDGSLRKFDAAGRPISPPSPFGGEGLYGAAAINPTNGDLYVFEVFNYSTSSPMLDTYDPNTGKLISSFPVPGPGFPQSVQIAADFAGNVYVPVIEDNDVLEYNPTGTLLNTFKGSGAGALKEPHGVTLDSSGNLWVADTANNRIEELSASGSAVGEIASEGVTSVALGPHGEVFGLVVNAAESCGATISPCPHLIEYSSAGAVLADVGTGIFEGAGFYGVLNMVAANDSNGLVYVTDDAKNSVWIYGPPMAPQVTKELAAEVGTDEAKLGALVSPGGLHTSYRVEYGTTDAYGRSSPYPEGDVGDGLTARAVWASASELMPGTTYHFRVIATSELGTAVGPDQTFTTETPEEASCPNEQLRGGFSTNLPECRAYELVTPPNDGSAGADTELAARPFRAGGGLEANFASRSGERLTYRTSEPLPGAESSGYEYLATRGTNGWSSEDLIPRESYDGNECNTPGGEFNSNEMMAYSDELTSGILRVGGGDSYGSEHGASGCGAEGLEVVQGEPWGVENLLLRDNTTGSYRLINTVPSGLTPTNGRWRGGSADLSHIIFSETTRLTENAPAGVENLYEWDGGVTRLVTVLPNGTPVVGSLPPDPGAVSSRASVVSADGARVFFTAGGNLYVRINGDTSLQLDEARGGTGPGGGGSFQAASTDGAQAFFTDEASAGLTSDTGVGSGKNLYRFADGQLTDLTPAEHAEVVRVSGVSEDGSYVYFVADGVLSGSQTNKHGETAQAGLPNMYLWHGGATTFIATLRSAATEEAISGAVRVSPNGHYLAFASRAELTGYDNTDSVTSYPDPEIFLYTAESEQLVCVSCSPLGEPPSGGGRNEGGEGGATLDGLNGSPGGGTPHYLTNSGHVFFDTGEALLPRDTNGQFDVYEYANGQLSLISSGSSSAASMLIDAGESGNDVFFLSRQKLVAQDAGTEALVIYDARVDGGFPAVASPPPCATVESCRSAPVPEPSLFGAPPSQTFSGAGNLTQTPPGKAGKPTPKQRSHSALEACARRYRHNRHRRVVCQHRARAQYASGAHVHHVQTGTQFRHYRRAK